MAYSELIKNFERIREYLRGFYVYGFKRRDDFDQKSGRSYDNERRRIESYLGEYMSFRQKADGKNVFLSIDSRRTPHNPLYQAWKAKSFTDKDITLHFILMDLLPEEPAGLTLVEILDLAWSRYRQGMRHPMDLDESTARKRLKEYEGLGLVVTWMEGRQRVYSRRKLSDLTGWEDALAFFSEIAPEGVVGSFLLDWMGASPEEFAFKHHDITRALESGVLEEILEGISGRRDLVMTDKNRKTGKEHTWDVTPLRIYLSTQNGRSYLIGRDNQQELIRSWRLDFITGVKSGIPSEAYEEALAELQEMQKHMWGICCKGPEAKLEHVEFTIHMEEDEEYIYERLMREKRCGTVERTDANTCRFTADVYDSSEMIPWIRTWICRIEQLEMSNRSLENRFRRDLEKLYQMYGIGKDEGGEPDGVL